MDVLSYIIASRLLSCSGGNGANIKLDENGNIITDEDVIVEFGNNKNCRIPMQKAAIAQIEKPNAD